MNILLITDVYTPNANSSAVLMRDLAQSLVRSNITVNVLTLMECNISETVENVVEEDGVKILRVSNLKKKKVGMIYRGLSEMLLPFFLYRGYKKHIGNVKPDLIICYSPPITLANTVKKLKRKYGSKVYLVLRDIFPQCAKDVGVLKPGLVFNFFKKIENKLYRLSDIIGVQSLSDLKSVQNHSCVQKEKVELLYNWIDLAPFEKRIERNFRQEWGLQNKIICLYAGNIGKYQDLKFLFELIKINNDKTDVAFLVVGSGTESSELRELYGHFDQVLFKEFINPEHYPDLVRQCDIGLINLNKDLTVQNIPGKLMGYWCSKLPVLASVNKGNELQMMMKEANGGFCSITGDLQQYNDNFNRLYKDKALRKEQGKMGYEFAIKHFSVDNTKNKILNHFYK